MRVFPVCLLAKPIYRELCICVDFSLLYVNKIICNICDVVVFFGDCVSYSLSRSLCVVSIFAITLPQNWNSLHSFVFDQSSNTTYANLFFSFFLLLFVFLRHLPICFDASAEYINIHTNGSNTIAAFNSQTTKLTKNVCIQIQILGHMIGPWRLCKKKKKNLRISINAFSDGTPHLTTLYFP